MVSIRLAHALTHLLTRRSASASMSLIYANTNMYAWIDLHGGIACKHAPDAFTYTSTYTHGLAAITMSTRLMHVHMHAWPCMNHCTRAPNMNQHLKRSDYHLLSHAYTTKTSTKTLHLVSFSCCNHAKKWAVHTCSIWNVRNYVLQKVLLDRNTFIKNSERRVLRTRTTLLELLIPPALDPINVVWPDLKFWRIHASII